MGCSLTQRIFPQSPSVLRGRGCSLVWSSSVLDMTKHVLIPFDFIWDQNQLQLQIILTGKLGLVPIGHIRNIGQPLKGKTFPVPAANEHINHICMWEKLSTSLLPESGFWESPSQISFNIPNSLWYHYTFNNFPLCQKKKKEVTDYGINYYLIYVLMKLHLKKCYLRTCCKHFKKREVRHYR